MGLPGGRADGGRHLAGGEARPHRAHHALGAEGYGYLDALFGLGALVGGVLAIARASRGRMGSDLIVGVLLCSLPLALIWAWPHLVTCVVAMLLLGLGNPLVDVNLDTLVQRLTPDDVLGRVFGAYDSLLVAAMALGAFHMPLLLHLLGLHTSMLVIAVAIGLVVLLVARPLRRLDRTLDAPRNLQLWSRIDFLSPSPPPPWRRWRPRPHPSASPPVR